MFCSYCTVVDKLLIQYYKKTIRKIPLNELKLIIHWQFLFKSQNLTSLRFKKYQNLKTPTISVEVNNHIYNKNYSGNQSQSV